jgi:membrane protease YdiL (CAAX protease family)
MIGIVVFVLVALGGAWLVALPLWLSGQGLATSGAVLIMTGMMFTPTVAALVASRVAPSGAGFMRATGLRSGRPFRAWRGYVLIAWLAPIAAVIAALALAMALGIFRVDLVGFSGFAAYLDTASGGKAPSMSVPALVAIQLGGSLILPFVANTIPALGEELGWRGFLLPRLCRFGQWPAVLLTGVIWGLWHAPLILLGFNYPGLSPWLALLYMVVFCVLVSVLFGWLRLASGSIWPSTVAHGFVNGWARLGALVAVAGQAPDAASVGLLGWSGWIVLAALIVTLVAMRRFPVRHQRLAERPGVDAYAGAETA